MSLTQTKPHVLRTLREAALHVALAEGFRRGSISIAVIDGRRMARIHREFLAQSGPTDVITFDLGTDRRRRTIEGEIVVCETIARREATAHVEKRGLAAEIEQELVLYVIHAVLHLAGYNDQSPKNFEKMHRIEDEYLSQLGFNKVFISR